MHPTFARLMFWRNKDARMAEFAETEAFGARDLARAAERVKDPWLRRQLIKHAQDEVRHARLLNEQVATGSDRALGASLVGETVQDAGIDIDKMGEVGFIAFVHAAEKRATAEFAMHQEALGKEGEFFASILEDEKRHVAWTGHQLDKWRQAGRGAEVDSALRSMQWDRVKNVWLWIARRISLVTSTVLLTGVYLVVVAPFKLLAGAWRTGWVGATPTKAERQF